MGNFPVRFHSAFQGFPSRLAASLFFSALLLSSASIAQQRAPDPLDHHYSAAQTFQLGGDLEHAETEYHMVLAIALQRMSSLLAAEQNDSKEAIHLLEDAVAAQPAYLDAHVDLAMVYFRAGQLDRAADHASQVLKDDPRNVPALQLLGNIEFAQGKFASAEEHLRTALGLHGEFDTAYSLALVYLSQHKWAETRLLFNELLNDMGSTPELHVLLGRTYRETGYFDEAILEFKKAIEMDPHYPRVHYYLALVYLAQGEKERIPTARALFEQELAINPKEFFSTFFLGVIDLEERNFPAAEEYLKRAVQLQPENPDPLLYLGQVYFETSHPELAIKALRKSIDLTTDPSHNRYQVSKAHTMIGQILMKMGKQDEAEAELNRSQELRTKAFQSDKARQEGQERGLPDLLPELQSSHEKPSFLESHPPIGPAEQKQNAALRAALTTILGNAYNNLGVIRARNEQYVQAADYFQKAWHWMPSLEGLDRNWGLAAFHAQRFEEAAGPLARQLARQPGDGKARDALGVSYFLTNQFAKTVETFQPLLKDLPDDPGVLYALGVSLDRTGNSQMATRVFRRMLEKNPNDPGIHVLLGRASAGQNQYTPALEEFSRALQLDPKAEGAHFGRGMILLHEGKLDDAAQEFRAELDSHAADAEAKYHLAYVLLDQQQKDQAFALLTEVIRDKPDYADAQYQMGKMLLERGDVKGAIERLETAVRLDPTKDYSQFQLSVAYRRDGRAEDAQRVLLAYQALKAKKRGADRQ